MTKQNRYPLHFASNFSEVVLALEVLPRTGWVQWGIHNPETVWEHILATRELAIAYRDKLGLNETEFVELLDMIEIHDWPESMVGDGVILGDEPNVETMRSNKKKKEMEAMEKICANRSAGAEIHALYVRYANGSDRVARLVKQIEKLQAVIKAAEYEHLQNKEGLTSEFVHYTRDLIQDSFLTNEFKKIAMSITILLLIIQHSVLEMSL